MTYAVRASKVNGFDIAEGDIIGLADDQLVAVGKKPEQALAELLDKMVAKPDALISIYYGRDVNQEDRKSVV